MSLFHDGVTSAVERAMDAVALRQRVVAQNVANAMTPGYQARRVEFESALAEAVRSGSDLTGFRAAATPTGAPSREDGNNVQLEHESSALLQSGLHFDALVQVENYKHSVLRSAVRG